MEQAPPVLSGQPTKTSEQEGDTRAAGVRSRGGRSARELRGACERRRLSAAPWPLLKRLISFFLPVASFFLWSRNSSHRGGIRPLSLLLPGGEVARTAKPSSEMQPRGRSCTLGRRLEMHAFQTHCSPNVRFNQSQKNVFTTTSSVIESIEGLI